MEECLWRLSRLYGLLGLLPLFRGLETWVAALPPYGALACFALPAIALAPIKILALYWLAGGHPVLGIGSILGAKVAGTALVARIYQLTRGSLRQLPWFVYCEDKVLAWRAAAYGMWRNSTAGRWVAQNARAARVWWRSRRLLR